MRMFCVWLPVRIEADSFDDARLQVERIWREATTPEPQPRQQSEVMLRTLMMGRPQ